MSSESILLVCHNEDLASAVSLALSRTGFSVTPASSIEEGIREAGKREHDLLFLLIPGSSLLIPCYRSWRLFLRELDRIEGSLPLERGALASPQDLHPSTTRLLREVYRTLEVMQIKEESLWASGKVEEEAIWLLKTMALSLEERNPFFRGHSQRVARYALALGSSLGLSQEFLHDLGIAATLHDVGMVGVREEVLNKPGPLTPEEYQEIKGHPVTAQEFLHPFEALQSVSPMVLYHHEWWNGEGYPSGLIAEEIPLGARILAVAEMYESLTHARPYRKGYSHHEAVKIMEEQKGIQLDPDLVIRFLALTGEKQWEEKGVESELSAPPVPKGRTVLALGSYLLLHKDFLQARKAFQEGITLAKEGKYTPLLVPALLGLARSVAGSGEGEATLAILGEARKAAGTGAEGQTRPWSASMYPPGEPAQGIPGTMTGAETLSAARILLTEGILSGKSPRAGELLSLAADLLEHQGEDLAQTRAQFSLLSTGFSAPPTDPALYEQLRSLLFLAERLEMEGLFIRTPEDGVPILLEALSRGISTGFACRLLTEIGEAAEEPLLNFLKSATGEAAHSVLEILTKIGGEKTKEVLRSFSFLDDLALREKSIQVLKGVARKGAERGGTELLEISLFGPLKVIRHGGPLAEEELKARKTGSIFAFLLTYPDRSVSEDRLLDTFWPDVNPERGRRSLHTSVYRLRRALEADLKKGEESSYIMYKNHFYYFNRESRYWLDIEEFERHYKLGQLFASRGNLEEAARELGHARSLYPGPYFQDNVEEEWCLEYREYYEGIFLRILLSLAHYAGEKRAWRESLEYAREAARIDSASEEAHQAIMKGLMAIGKKDEAVKHYHHCTEILMKRLGISPSEETVKLYLSLVQGAAT